jgi:hypothetical protein
MSWSRVSNPVSTGFADSAPSTLAIVCSTATMVGFP